MSEIYLHRSVVNSDTVVLLRSGSGVLAAHELDGSNTAGPTIRTIRKGRSLDRTDDLAEVFL